MSQFNQILTAIVLTLLIVVLVLFAVTAYVLYQVAPSIGPTVRDLHVTILEAGLTLKNLREASLEWKNASQVQSQSSTAILASTKTTMLSLKSLLDSTNSSLNSQLLPSLSNAIAEQNGALLESQKQLQGNLENIAEATQQLQKTLADADAQISNPAIGQAVDHLATASQNASDATGEAAASMKKIHEGVDKEVDALLAPVNKAKAAALFIVQLLGRLYGF